MSNKILNQYLTIKLDNTKIELISSHSLTYDNTNLPKRAFSFKTHQPLFWKLKQKHFDSTSGTLVVEVVEYNSLPYNILTDDVPEYQINYLSFEKLDWPKFEPLLFSYTLSQLKDSIFNYRDKLLDLGYGKNDDTRFLKRTDPNLFFAKREPDKQEKEFEVKVKYEDAKFDISKICFSVNLKPYKVVRQLEIGNLHLKPEFEYIKPYIVKRLGKCFLAKIKLKLLDNEIEDIAVHSDDIDRINDDLIKAIRISSVLNLRHLKIDRVDKNLYNTKELTSETKELSLINATAKDILEIFIQNANVKNVRQLEYLARDKQDLNERVQFTFKPLFGFVFYELNNKHCFIWELLNSHATYIWKSNSAENNLYLGKVVEQAIAIIKNDGREVYKKFYKTIENPNYDFGIIDHSSNNLTDDERFNEWRNKLERFCS